MDFEPSEEQRALRRTIREFAVAEIAPHAAGWDARAEFPLDVVRRLAALGVMGLPFPEDEGGVGAGAVELAIVIEELARVDSSVAITVSANVGLAGDGPPPVRQSERRSAAGWCRWRAARRSAPWPARNPAPAPTWRASRPPRACMTVLAPQRHQGLHHQRRHAVVGLRGHDGHHRPARRRPPRDQHVARPQRHARLPAWQRPTTNSAGTPRTPVSWSSTTAWSRKTTWSARVAPARGNFWRCWTAAASAWPRWRSAWPRERSIWPSPTRSSAWPSARRSPTPGHSVPARRRGHRNRGGAPARLPRRHAARTAVSRSPRPRPWQNCSPPSWRSAPANVAMQVHGGYGYMEEAPMPASIATPRS